MRSERSILQRELAAYLREKDAAQLRLLRAQIAHARVDRRHKIAGARTQCRTARASLREQQKTERAQFVELQRAARADEREVCSSGKARAKSEGVAGELGAKRTLAEQRKLQRQVRNADKRNVTVRTTKRERSQEDDDAVRSNLPAELVPVFNVVAKRIKGSARRTRTEAFLEWAEENPDEIIAVQQAEADQYLKDLIKHHRELGRSVRKADRYEKTPEELAELLAEVPF